jgi:hypothetical protein
MKTWFRLVAAVAAITCAAGVAACSAGGAPSLGHAAVPATTWHATTATSGTPSARRSGPAPLIGVYIKGLPATTAPLSAFRQQTALSPRIVLYFSGWGEQFQKGFATTVTDEGATPLVQLESENISLQEIADGAKDNYLDSFARGVRDFGHPVILSYGHEMNGNWYHWGWKRTPATTFVAAWRHIVQVFRDQGAKNVTWMWTVQAAADAPTLTANPAPWWPGSNYVDWVGIDGHYIYHGQTFHSIFDPAIATVRRITSKPILIAETSISKSVGQTTVIPDLFQGVASRGLLGFVYFDKDGNHDYRLDTPTVFAAFTKAAKAYGYSS